MLIFFLFFPLAVQYVKSNGSATRDTVCECLDERQHELRTDGKCYLSCPPGEYLRKEQGEFGMLGNLQCSGRLQIQKIEFLFQISAWGYKHIFSFYLCSLILIH